MKATNLASSLIGGAIVAFALLVLGIAGRGTTRTIVEEAPLSTMPASSSDSGLTPHDIYQRDAPGVVFVRAQIVQQVEDPFDLFPQQERSISTGSGFLMDRRGFILTNYHVIEGADRATGVTVQFEDNVNHAARVVGVDASNDLALLKVDTNRTFELLPDVPNGATVVAESGFSRREELELLIDAGVDAVLVGEALMRSADIEAACRTLTAGI
jgi:S1-C subfamily serine protease